MGGDATAGVDVRAAGPDDRLAVARIVDGAALEVEDLPSRLEAGEVLVAERRDHVVGAIVLAEEGPEADTVEPPDPVEWRDAAHVRALAVRRRQRDRGVGTALVRAAVERFGPLVVDFDESIAAFYRSLGATVHTDGSGRCWALVDDP